MRVGFDIKALRSGGHRASAYFLELLPELLGLAEDNDELLVFRSDEAESEDDAPLAWLLRDDKLRQLNAPFRGRRSAGLWRSLSFPAVERLVSGPDARRLGPLDACHSFHPPLMPSRAACKVLTIHHLDNNSDRKLPAPLRRSLSSADAVIVPSNVLEAEMIDRLRLTHSKPAPAIEEKTMVIRPGVHGRYHEAPKTTQIEALCERYPFLDEPYLLAAGGAADVDASLPLLADACAEAGAQDDSLPPLVVLAQPEHSASVVELISSRGLEGRLMVIEDVTTDTLPALYRGAELLLYPSPDYAFGLAVAEAAANSVPSIVGPGCGASEIVAGCTVVTEPEGISADSSAWAAAIQSLHVDAPERRKLGGQARFSIRDRSWRQAAEEHWLIYRRGRR